MPDLDPGLTTAEVAARVAAGRTNRMPPEGWRPFADIVRRNTLTLFNALVAPAALGLFLLKDFRGAWAVGGMATANALLGMAHELRAKRHLDRLSLLGEAVVRVRRDGAERSVPAGDVVAGDLVLLAAGDTVAADGTAVEASFLEMDEALLTGEADPVPRAAGDAVRSGSVCVAGAGAYRAERVGGDAYAQRIAAAARQYRHAPGPTQRTLDRLVQWLTALTVVLCLGYVGLYFARGFPAAELVRMIAATITSMVPQGLVLLATLTFVLAAARLGARGAVVQRLGAVEGMAAIDVLCADKTGTLTSGRLTLERLSAFGEPEALVREQLGGFAAASVDRRNKSIETLRAALAPAPPLAAFAQLPFQSQHRCSAAKVRVAGAKRLLVLGSVDALAPRFPEAARIPFEAAWHEWLPTGLRLLAFADGPADELPFAGRLPEGPLRPLALIALRDEPRPGTTDVIDMLAAQGIRLKVVSGDHPETVRATVRSLGAAFRSAAIMTGDAWSAAAERDARAEDCDVFGRMSPEQKLALVEALQRRGRNVGMIGDGVNDVLPIKRADFGVAMGAGSPATKAVAGMVLASNDFAVLPEALAEGRRVVRNVRRAAKLFLLKNSCTAALILVAVGMCGLPFPYLPQQVTLLNVLTIGGPAALILASRTPAAGAVGSRFFADVGRFVALAGGATSVVALVVYLGAFFAFGLPVESARTLLLATLVFAGAGHAVVATRGDWRLIAWGAAAGSTLMLAVAIPPTAYFFALAPLTPTQWTIAALAAAAAIIPAAWDEASARADGNRSPAAGGPTPDGPAASGSPSPPE